MSERTMGDRVEYATRGALRGGASPVEPAAEALRDGSQQGEDGRSEGIGAAAARRLRADIARSRLHWRGTSSLPANREAAAWELETGERARLSSRPNSRRWRKLDKLEAAVDEANRRLVEGQARLQAADEQLREAPAADEQALADWLDGGEKGDRPVPTVPERELRRNAEALLVGAAQRVVDRELRRKEQHVAKYRGRMLKELLADLAADAAAYEQAARALPAARDRVLETRELVRWLANYPGEAQPQFGNPTDLFLGLLLPARETLQTDARLQFDRLVDALARDASVLATRFGRPIEEKLGTARELTPEDTSMWGSDERHKAWARQKLEQAQQLAEFGDVQRLAEEARDFRLEPGAG